MNTLYKIDENETLKVSHKNPEIIELYDNYLGKPLGHKSHELLHTKYKKRRSDDITIVLNPVCCVA